MERILINKRGGISVLKTNQENISIEKIINLLKDSEDDGTFYDSLYNLFLLIGIAKGIEDVRNGKEMTIEESRERMMQKYETYTTKYGS